jgi:hypothetical protein
MPDVTPPTDPNALLFPAFIYGDKTTCRRKMKAEAKKWAKCYVESREFPELKMVPIPAGSIVFTDETLANFVGAGYSFSADRRGVVISANPEQKGLHIQWRAYMLEKLQFEAERATDLNRAECFPFRSAFVPLVCRYAWGAIAAATCYALLNSIERTVPRIEGVLRHWEALDTLRYIDFDQRPISLAELMVYYFKGHIAMWVDDVTGNVKADLQTAIDQMRDASEEEIRVRLVHRLRQLVDNDEEKLEHRDWLKSPGVMEAALEAKRQIGQDLYDDLTSGQLTAQRSFLHHLDKKYPGG